MCVCPCGVCASLNSYFFFFFFYRSSSSYSSRPYGSRIPFRTFDRVFTYIVTVEQFYNNENTFSTASPLRPYTIVNSFFIFVSFIKFEPSKRYRASRPYRPIVARVRVLRVSVENFHSQISDGEQRVKARLSAR